MKLDNLILEKRIANKVIEFQQKGYPYISKEDLGMYLVSYRWRQNSKDSFFKRLKDINEVTINEYFDYLQLKIRMEDGSNFDWNHLEDLF